MSEHNPFLCAGVGKCRICTEHARKQSAPVTSPWVRRAQQGTLPTFSPTNGHFAFKGPRS